MKLPQQAKKALFRKVFSESLFARIRLLSRQNSPAGHAVHRSFSWRLCGESEGRQLAASGHQNRQDKRQLFFRSPCSHYDIEFPNPQRSSKLIHFCSRKLTHHQSQFWRAPTVLFASERGQGRAAFFAARRSKPLTPWRGEYAEEWLCAQQFRAHNHDG